MAPMPVAAKAAALLLPLLLPLLLHGAAAQTPNNATCTDDAGCGGSASGSCVNGTCACRPGFTGSVCDVVTPCNRQPGLVCSGHGVCNSVSNCRCDVGYIGYECEIKIENSGMTSGDLAGAALGGLIISSLVLGLVGFLLAKYGQLGRCEASCDCDCDCDCCD